MKRVATVLGTRPESIKMSPVVRACEGSGAEWFMVHTGQDCYCDVDPGVLRGLGLPDAKDNLDVESGSGRHGEQTGKTWWVDVNSNEDIRQGYEDVKI